MHARLRNNCSNPNNDLFRNHICVNPLYDLRGMVEDAIHYFFHCRKFTIVRQVFNDTIRVFQPLSIDMILYGNYNLNMENNIVLFRAVHRYIYALCLKFLLKHILYINKYTYDQIYSIPKLKGFLAVVLFSFSLFFFYFLFCFLNYPILIIYLFIYLLF